MDFARFFFFTPTNIFRSCHFQVCKFVSAKKKDYFLNFIQQVIHINYKNAIAIWGQLNKSTIAFVCFLFWCVCVGGVLYRLFTNTRLTVKRKSNSFVVTWNKNVCCNWLQIWYYLSGNNKLFKLSLAQGQKIRALRWSTNKHHSPPF